MFFGAIEVSAPQDHLFVAARLYGDAVRGLQLACSDDRDRMPWEPGHRTAGQPLLGRRGGFCEEHRQDRLGGD